MRLCTDQDSLAVKILGSRLGLIWFLYCTVTDTMIGGTISLTIPKIDKGKCLLPVLPKSNNVDRLFCLFFPSLSCRRRIQSVGNEVPLSKDAAWKKAAAAAEVAALRLLPPRPPLLQGPLPEWRRRQSLSRRRHQISAPRLPLLAVALGWRRRWSHRHAASVAASVAASASEIRRLITNPPNRLSLWNLFPILIWNLFSSLSILNQVGRYSGMWDSVFVVVEWFFFLLRNNLVWY